MTSDALRESVLDALREVAPDVDAAGLDPRVSFRDQTEMDSVDFLNFVLALEKRVDRKIPEYDYPKLSSVQGCLNYLA